MVGGNFAAIRAAAQASDLLGTEAVPQAVAALQIVRKNKLLVNGRVDLEVLADVRAHVDRAAESSGRARKLVIRHHFALLPKVRGATDLARDRIVNLDSALRSAEKALHLAPSMLGQDGARRYFVAVQNPAEARATGGLVGAFALVTANGGRIKLDHTGSDSEFTVTQVRVPADPAAAISWQEQGSTRAWYYANLTPHFPDAARNLAELWTRQSGQRIDGVVALDPLVMAELLAATGPVRLPDGFAVTARNVVDFVGHDEYVRYPDVARRKRLLSTLAADLFHQVLASKAPVSTLQAMGRAASSGHLYIWSAHREDAVMLAAGLVGGALPSTNTPYLSVLTQNFGGDKLDFYIRKTVVLTRDASGQLTLRVTLRNLAPPGLPLYMTVRSDKPDPPVPYGQAKVALSVYGAKSTEVSSITVDSKPQTARFDHDRGHRVGTLLLEVPRDREVTVVVHLTEPSGVLEYRQQPLVVPDTLDIRVPHTVVGR